ncbi:MAG: Ltp family lipoprotein, partial [Eubacterium sp.]|nr:Ltp family lipoprotein [Eubacterium sp.]
WKEQALKWAKDHPEVANMSRQELIDKLVSEGFTEEEAEYGVSQFGY